MKWPWRAAMSFALAFAFIFVGFGGAAYYGGRDYLGRVLGDPGLADAGFERLLGGHGDGVALFGFHAHAPQLLALAAALLAATLVVFVLLPVALALHFKSPPRRWQRELIHVGAAALATAALLLSVHPVLNLQSVPEGPRTFLNYAFESVGYGWVNFMAYLGALGTAWVFARTATVAKAKPAEDSEAEPMPSEVDTEVGRVEPSDSDST